MRVVVIIPARDEERAIGRVLADVPSGLVDELVVVDNGSSDATAERARAAGATVLREPRPGYGRACLRGLAHARRRPPDVVVFLDGDHSDHPDEMPRLLAPIRRGEADLVIGSRILGRRLGMVEPGALLPQALVGNRVACAWMRLVWGVRFTDLGPFRAVRFAALETLGMRDPTFGWTVEMQIRAARAGLRCREVPVSYRRRIGTSKVTGTLAGTVRASAGILGTLARHTLAHAAGRARP